MKMPRIAAVFATMNRATMAESCLRALAGQTQPPEWVVVADNVSSDGTAESIESLGELPFQLVVHRMLENRGNAGGVEEAMEMAFAMGADAVWILDDDSHPEATALEALMAPGWSPDVVRHSLQIDPRTQGLTWPLPIEVGDGEWRFVDRREQLPEFPTIHTAPCWTGAMISRVIREKVGPVLGELFIRGEDEEFSHRISDAGYRFEVVPASVLQHPGPGNIRRWKFCGKNFFFEPGLADWKLYYKVRNMVWLHRRRKGLHAACLMVISYTLASWVCDGPRRLPTVWRAAWDGLLGKLGRWKKHVTARPE